MLRTAEPCMHAPTGAERSGVALLLELGDHLQEGDSALETDPLNSAIPFPVHHDEQLIIGDGSERVTPVGVAPSAGWHKVRGVVVPSVVIKMVDDERIAAPTLLAWPPVHAPSAPMAAVRAVADLVEQDLPVLPDLNSVLPPGFTALKGCVDPGERMTHRDSNGSVAHASESSRYSVQEV